MFMIIEKIVLPKIRLDPMNKLNEINCIIVQLFYNIDKSDRKYSLISFIKKNLFYFVFFCRKFFLKIFFRNSMNTNDDKDKTEHHSAINFSEAEKMMQSSTNTKSPS